MTAELQPKEPFFGSEVRVPGTPARNIYAPEVIEAINRAFELWDTKQATGTRIDYLDGDPVKIISETSTRSFS
jgi:hypothetical protein